MTVRSNMSWNVTEKEVLLQELINRNYETEVNEDDLEELGQYVNKTKDQVKLLLDNFKKQAENELETNIIRLNSSYSKPADIKDTEPPLNKWIWLLKQSGHRSNVFYEAIQMISDFEDHPSPEECDGINLKFLYSVVANFFSANDPQRLDRKHELFLKNTFSQLSYNVKNSEKSEKVEFAQNITRLFPDVGWNKNMDLSAIPGFVEFCCKNNYNPLDLPFEFLENDIKLNKQPEKKTIEL